MSEALSTLTGAVFLQNTTPNVAPAYSLPDPTTVEEGKLLTLRDAGSNAETYPWELYDHTSTLLHRITTNGGWAQFIAGPTTWLRLAASDLYGIQDFSITNLKAYTISSLVYTDIASFSSFTDPTIPSTAAIFNPIGGSISTLEALSTTFLTDAQENKLLVSSGVLLYAGENYSLNITTEVLQTFTFS